MSDIPGPERWPERLARRSFVVGIAGLPLWWLLGLVAVVPFGIAACMAWDLWTRRQVVRPPLLGWWLLFLLWVLLGLGTLWAAAPGAAGDGGGGRLLVFGYRFGWYVACTVVLVWICNTSVRRMPDRAVRRLFAWIFVVTTVGGVLGVLAPDLVVTTLVERVLPSGLRSNAFVHSLVSAETADVQEVLGEPEPRPKAPFPFTNTWGSVLTLSLVFFVAAAAGLRWRWRWVAFVVLAVAAVPVVLSLNRGLWLALAAGAVGLVVLLALRGRLPALAALVALVVVGGVVLYGTPLGETIGLRIENPHSNDRRGQLLIASVESVTSGSPIVGFGGTRDVEGTFSSIAGGATPDCPACGVPPLGTQGQLWNILFAQGWLGLLFFLTFFVLALARTWRCRTTNEAIASFVVGAFLLQLATYDTLGLPMLMVMVALGPAWREQLDAVARVATLRAPRTVDVVVVAVTGVLGAGAGAAVAVGEESQVTSTVTVALTATPTYLDPGAPLDWQDLQATTNVELPEAATVDTEAALLRSERTLRRAGLQVDMPVAALRAAISVSAPPLSSVLDVTATTSLGRDPRAVALAVTRSYLTERHRYLEDRRTDLMAQLREELASIDVADAGWSVTQRQLRDSINHLTTHRAEVGRVIRAGQGRPAKSGRDVGVTTGLGLGLLCGIMIRRGSARGGSRR